MKSTVQIKLLNLALQDVETEIKDHYRAELWCNYVVDEAEYKVHIKTRETSNTLSIIAYRVVHGVLITEAPMTLYTVKLEERPRLYLNSRKNACDEWVKTPCKDAERLLHEAGRLGAKGYQFEIHEDSRAAVEAYIDNLVD